jgi:hypothetical protein
VPRLLILRLPTWKASFPIRPTRRVGAREFGHVFRRVAATWPSGERHRSRGLKSGFGVWFRGLAPHGYIPPPLRGDDRFTPQTIQVGMLSFQGYQSEDQ